MIQGTIFDIKHFAIHDGPGIRTTVFLKGCPLDCWWCHNPEGRRSDPELVAMESGRGPSVPVGCLTTAAAVMAALEKDVLFYDESGGGATFSGGEPLMQPAFLAELLSQCRRQGIHTALDTAGCAPPETFRKIAPLVDLFLYDLKIVDDAQHRAYAGVTNRDILHNLRYLAASGCEVRIRFPLVPKINDKVENIDAMQTLLHDLGLQRIDILPYHGIHRQKYKRLGRDNRLEKLAPPSDEAVARVRRQFEAGGFAVNIGG
jgi:pyruvate formate lyase activating enzyme